MSFKTKAAGLVAATALSLALTSGALAQTQTTVESEVVLAQGACSSGITEAEVNFGTYVYEATTGKYVPKVAGTDGRAVFTVSETSGSRQDNCAIRVVATSLTSPGSPLAINVTIAQSDATANTSTSDGTLADAGITVMVAPGGGQPVNASLPADLSNIPSPATYTGSITVSVESGSS